MVRRAERLMVIGVDLGKMRDFTALAVVERYSEWARWNPVQFCDEYEWRVGVRMLERVRLRTSYARVVEWVREVTARAAQEGRCTVVVEATGVGMPDALRSAGMDCELVGVTMTAGEKATRVRGRVDRTEEGGDGRAADDVCAGRAADCAKYATEQGAGGRAGRDGERYAGGDGAR